MYVITRVRISGPCFQYHETVGVVRAHVVIVTEIIDIVLCHAENLTQCI